RLAVGFTLTLPLGCGDSPFLAGPVEPGCVSVFSSAGETTFAIRGCCFAHQTPAPPIPTTSIRQAKAATISVFLLCCVFFRRRISAAVVARVGAETFTPTT